MSSLQTQAITDALAAAGRTLTLAVSPIDVSVMPALLGAGYAVTGAIVGKVLLCLRRASPGRVVDITITAFDASATHTAIIGGNSVAYSGAPADIPALCTAWASAITADGTVGSSGSAYQTSATAIASVSGGTVDTVRITGLSPDSWSFTATFTGSATADVTLDPESCTMTVYETHSDVASLVTYAASSDDANAMRGWSIMQGVGGDAVLAVADGQNRTTSVVVAGATSVRPYIPASSVGYVAGDGTVGATTSGATYAGRSPLAVVIYGRVVG